MTLSLGALQTEEVSVAVQILLPTFSIQNCTTWMEELHCTACQEYQLKVSQGLQASSSDTNLHFLFYLFVPEKTGVLILRIQKYLME